MTQAQQLELAPPEIAIDNDSYCVPCKKQLKNKFGLTMHRLRFHDRRGVRAIKLPKKRGRPLGSKTKKSNYCVPCKKSFKGSHGLSIHNAQVHVDGASNNNHKTSSLIDGGKVRASIQPQSHAAEEIHLAFLAGALCERLILSQRTELLTELITGRLSAARVAGPQVR